MDINLTVALVAGAFLIVGTIVSAVTSYLTTSLQLNKNKDLDIDRRLFDARRAAYEKAMSMMSKAHSERINGRMWPASSLDPDNDKTLEMMGAVTLWSKKETVTCMREFFIYLGLPIPQTIEEKDRDMISGNQLWQALIRAFRDEVGTGEFLEESIPNLPTEKETKQ